MQALAGVEPRQGISRSAVMWRLPRGLGLAAPSPTEIAIYVRQCQRPRPVLLVSRRSQDLLGATTRWLHAGLSGRPPSAVFLSL